MSPLTAGRWPVGPGRARRSVNRCGRDATLIRDRRDDRRRVDPDGAVPPGDHPARQVAVDPVADRPVEVRGEVDRRAGAAAVGRSDQHGRADVVARLGLQDADRRDPAAVRGDRGLGGRAARGEDLARLGGPASPGASTSTAQIVDLGARSGCGPRSLVKTTRPPVGMPGDVAHAPVAARDLPRRGAACEVHDEQVRPAVQVALLVPAPVDAVDPARARAVLVGRPDAGDRPDEPARRVDLGGERDAGPVRRPGDLAHPAVAAAPDGAHPAAVDADQPQGRGRVVVGGVGPDEGDGPPVRRDPRARVADDAAGQDRAGRRAIAPPPPSGTATRVPW